jgi:hypothetical protein
MYKYKQIAVLSFLVASAGLAGFAAADDKPYKEGAVTDVAFIRVKDGKLNDYLAYLNGPYRQEQEAQLKAGIITAYHIYEVPPRRPEDPNLILTITYPNFAALDRTAEIDAISAKVEGSLKAADQGTSDRGSIRQILGSELIQELILK